MSQERPLGRLLAAAVGTAAAVAVAAAAAAGSGAYLSAVVVEAPPIFPMASTRFHADYSLEFFCH
jgi:hypothetical protein